jgi:hypothetical protein
MERKRGIEKQGNRRREEKRKREKIEGKPRRTGEWMKEG